MADPAITLPPEDTDPGALARLLLLETRGPQQPGYDRQASLKAMRLMRRTVENRLIAPAHYAARGATSEQDILRMGNQFAGFRDYPTLPGPLALSLARLLAAANNGQMDVRTFVGDAITVATEAMSSPISTQVTAWRTTGSGSPGPGFQFLMSLQGNDFYTTTPMPSVAARHRGAGPYRTGHRSGSARLDGRP